MAQLIVRNVDEKVAERLKKEAASSGISMEEAHRRILKAALLEGRNSFKAALFSIPNVGRDEDFERGPQTEREVDL